MKCSVNSTCNGVCDGHNGLKTGVNTDANTNSCATEQGRIASVSLDSIMPLIKEQLALGESVKFSPRGVSMLPMLRQGVDSVVISPLPEQLKKYDIPLYQRDNGQYVLHRITAVEKGCYTCIGDNQYSFEKDVRHDQMIGVVTSFYRGDKCHKTGETGYRIYCVLWHKSRRIRHFALRGARWIKRRIG